MWGMACSRDEGNLSWILETARTARLNSCSVPRESTKWHERVPFPPVIPITSWFSDKFPSCLCIACRSCTDRAQSKPAMPLKPLWAQNTESAPKVNNLSLLLHQLDIFLLFGNFYFLLTVPTGQLYHWQAALIRIAYQNYSGPIYIYLCNCSSTGLFTWLHFPHTLYYPTM